LVQNGVDRRTNNKESRVGFETNPDVATPRSGKKSWRKKGEEKLGKAEKAKNIPDSQQESRPHQRV